MNDISLHNAEITAVEHIQENKELLIKAKLHTGERHQIVFQGIEWWELCSFGIQNVLFSITPYDNQSLTNAIVDDQDIADQYVKMVRDSHYTLFVLNASVGLSGWIIATGMQVKPMLEK